jgi:hypothetical protein
MKLIVHIHVESAWPEGISPPDGTIIIEILQLSYTRMFRRIVLLQHTSQRIAEKYSYL